MVRLDLEVFLLFLIEVKAWYFLRHGKNTASQGRPTYDSIIGISISEASERTDECTRNDRVTSDQSRSL